MQFSKTISIIKRMFTSLDIHYNNSLTCASLNFSLNRMQQFVVPSSFITEAAFNKKEAFISTRLKMFLSFDSNS